MNVAKGPNSMIWFCLPFCFREQTSGRKLFCAHYGRYWYNVTFWIRVVSVLSRRHGNHIPKRFDFPNECKPHDGNCQFYFSYKKYFLTMNQHINRWCVSKILQYIYEYNVGIFINLYVYWYPVGISINPLFWTYSGLWLCAGSLESVFTACLCTN